MKSKKLKISVVTEIKNKINAPKKPGMPKYMWLQNKLIEKIKSGKYKTGDILCTEKELIANYSLSISTITHALRKLEELGYIWRKQGAGTIVKSLTPEAPAQTNPGIATLFACNIVSTPTPDFKDINWFIGHELLRGIVNTFEGRVRLIEQEQLLPQLELINWQNAAVVISDPSDKILEELNRKKIPYCIIDRAKTASIADRANTINLDRMRGIYEGMSYLIDTLGHRDIALVSAMGKDLHHDRIAGYQIALHSFNIPCRQELEVRCENGLPENGAAAIRELLKRNVHFTAVFVDTDVKAVGAVKALQEAGLSVPKDISVLGFDDVPGIEKIEPPLTTIRMPHFEIGVAAIELLNERVKTGTDVPGRTLNTRLVIRQSCDKVQNR